MKRTYIRPFVQVIEVEFEEIIATSSGTCSADDGNSVISNLSIDFDEEDAVSNSNDVW